MTKSQTEIPHLEQQRRVACRTIEAPVIYELVQPDKDSYVLEYPRADSKSSHHSTAAPPLPRAYADDQLLQSEYSHHSPRSFTRSNVDGVTSPVNVTKISVPDSGNSKTMHVSSHANTARQSDYIPITEVRTAKDVPLPSSRVTSVAAEEGRESKAGRSLISPKESVSQLSTRRSGESGRSKHHGRLNPGSENHHGNGGHRSRTSKR